MAVKDLVVAQGPAAFMAQAAVQIPVFRGIQVVTVSSSLVKADSSSNSRVIKAIRSS